MATPHLEFATRLAKDAGAIMRAHFGLHTAVEWKEDNSPLTIADTKINRLVIERVKEAFPTHSILGEEESFQVENSPLSWVCDPIDGTVPYAVGIPISTFSLALVEDGVPILGVIYDPFSDRLFTAEKGKGAYLNGEPVHVSNQASFHQAHIECSGREFIPLLAHLLEQGAKGTRTYCLTCLGTLVAAGTFDAVLAGPLSNAWDIAALKIIVEEAGGKVTDIAGNEQRYDQKINGAIVSNGLLHDQLVELVKQLRS